MPAKSSQVDDLLNDAIAGTEKEIFEEAMGDEPGTEDADKSPEQMGDGPEGDDVEDDADDKAGDDEGAEEKGGEKAKDGDKGKTDDRDDKGRFKGDPEEPGRDDGRVPRGALREERSKRQAAETERDTLRKDFETLNSKLDETLRRVDGLARPAPKVEDKGQEPDIFADPEGFKKSIVDSVSQGYVTRRVEETFADAHDTHGKDFEAAYGALRQLNPQSQTDRALVQRISTAPNPGKALMKWHREQTTLREIGDDPAAYRQRVRDEMLKDPEVRKELVKSLRDEANGEGGGRRPNRILPSLNSASRGGSSRTGSERDPELYDDSEESVFEHATKE